MTDNDKSNADNIEWRVRVFRNTLSSGWETLQVTSGSSVRQTVRARPQKGSIVIRRLRLRVTLQPETVVTRRQNCLRVQSKHGVRVLILQFATARDCQSFGDVLMRLNPLPSVSPDLLSAQILRSSEHDRESVLFYVARLLYDPDFLEMVRSVEHTILASPEGQHLLDDLHKLMPNDDDNEDEQKNDEEEKNANEEEQQPQTQPNQLSESV
eukprot:scaffold1697_cov180-Amphora_coffeaeformis.AAC.38